MPLRVMEMNHDGSKADEDAVSNALATIEKVACGSALTRDPRRLMSTTLN